MTATVRPASKSGRRLLRLYVLIRWAGVLDIAKRWFNHLRNFCFGVEFRKHASFLPMAQVVTLLPQRRSRFLSLALNQIRFRLLIRE